jgi:hypothetical protein
MRLLCAAFLLAAATSAVAVNLKDPKESTEAYVRMRANSAGTDAVTYWRGQVFAVMPDKKPELLFGFEGFNVARFERLDDGKWRMLSREYAVYKDPKTGEILDQWVNPYTGETTKVFHVQNDPVNNTVGGFPMPFRELDDQVLLSFDVPLGYPNPISPDKYPKESTGEMYVGSEHFGFFAQRRHFDNRKLKSVPMSFSWARQSPWLPWMRMGDAPGILMFNAWGKKLERGYAGLPEPIRAHIEQHAPKFKTAPTQFVEPNATTWTEYRKQVLEAESEPKTGKQD